MASLLSGLYRQSRSYDSLFFQVLRFSSPFYVFQYDFSPVAFSLMVVHENSTVKAGGLLSGGNCIVFGSNFSETTTVRTLVDMAFFTMFFSAHVFLLLLSQFRFRFWFDPY